MARPFGRAAHWTCCLSVAAGVLATPAAAVTYEVTKTADTADGSCSATDCSLREAVIAANASAGADVVMVPLGTYELTRLTGTDPEQGDLDVLDSVTIRTPSRETDPTVIETALSERLVEVGVGGITVTLRGLVLQGGGPEPTGGAIRVVDGGALTLERCEVRDSEASFGGGISFEVTAQGTLIDSIVSGNSATTRAGGIDAPTAGTLTLIRTTVEGNHSDGDGGGIFAPSTVTIESSTVSGNTADDVGGGIHIPSGTTTIVDSSIVGNEAATTGGGVGVAGTLILRRSFVGANESVHGAGIFFFAVGSGLEVESSTFSLNTATGSGGGLYIDGPPGLVHISSATVAINVANSDGMGSGLGGGIYITGGASPALPTLRNTILANNFITVVSTPGDCQGSIDSLGYNLIESTLACTIVGVTEGNVLGVDPVLGLGSNGGPTLNFMPMAGSPALEAGDPTGCVDTAGVLLATDQRGFPRHVDDDADGVARCDIGAVERSLFSDDFETGDTSRWSGEVG